jgi:hypothetical protein
MSKAKRYGNASPFRRERIIRYGGEEHVVKNAAMWNDDMKEVLGVERTKHWPDEPLRGWFNGYELYLCRKGYTMTREGRPIESSSYKARRLFARCPHCSTEQWFCAGHIGQHLNALHAEEI